MGRFPKAPGPFSAAAFAALLLASSLVLSGCGPVKVMAADRTVGILGERYGQEFVADKMGNTSTYKGSMTVEVWCHEAETGLPFKAFYTKHSDKSVSVYDHYQERFAGEAFGSGVQDALASRGVASAEWSAVGAPGGQLPPGTATVAGILAADPEAYVAIDLYIPGDRASIEDTADVLCSSYRELQASAPGCGMVVFFALMGEGCDFAALQSYVATASGSTLTLVKRDFPVSAYGSVDLSDAQSPGDVVDIMSTAKPY